MLINTSDWTHSDWIQAIGACATCIAVLFAPIFTLWIGGIIQKRSDLEKQKLYILSVLISFRHDPLASDAIRSLNLIDAVFSDDYEVREAWTRYFAVLNDSSLNNPVGYSIRAEKRHELLLKMIEAVNLKGKVSSADLLRAYNPTSVGNQSFINYWDQQVKIKQIEDILTQHNIPFTPISEFSRSNQQATSRNRTEFTSPPSSPQNS